MSVYLACLIFLAPGAAGGEWPQFRGPAGNGIAATAEPPLEWSADKNITWKTSLPGCGRSSPVVLGDRIWLTFAVPQNVKRARIGPDDSQVADRVTFGAIALDRASGKCLWKATLFQVEESTHVHWLNSWATPTPVVEPGRLYCDFGAYGTACLESETGRLIWKQKLALDHQVGPGSSAVLYGDRVILVRDGRDAQYVAGLDKHTGRVAWKTNRPPLEATLGNYKKSFSTPLVIETGGRAQAIVPGAEWVVSYDPVSGNEVWRVRHGKGFSLAGRPVWAHGMVYVTTGAIGTQLWAIRADGRGDVTDTHVVWRATSQIPGMSSPLVVGDEVYCVSDAGVASCFDALTGEPRWRERIGGRYLASPVYAAGRLYFFNLEGKTTVLKAGKEFTHLAENTLEGPLVATPAMVGRAVFLRSDSYLYRLEIPSAD